MEKRLFSKKISVKETLGQKEGLILEKDINIAKELIEDSNIDILCPISGKIKMENKRDKLIVTFDLHTLVRFQCDRCLEEFEKKLNIKFTQKYCLKNKNKDILPIFPDQTIDIGDPIRQELLTSLPYKNLCQKDCKGLCNKCGSNLNKKNCGCK